MSESDDISCSQIFTFKNENASWPPIALSGLSASLLNQFSLEGKVPMLSQYYADAVDKQNGGIGYVWSKEEINRRIEDYKNGTNLSEVCYNTDVCTEALRKYPITGQHGIVFGSQSPWAESLLLAYGAKSIFTYEYMPIKTDHHLLSTGTPASVSSQYLKSTKFAKFDFGFSFSSFEHDGLGRYGDPLNPFGDIQSIRKASCLVKPGGFFFLGLPVGPDAVVFNAHRIYGRLRLPLIQRHWDKVEIIGSHSFLGSPGYFTQPIIVLVNKNVV